MEYQVNQIIPDFLSHYYEASQGPFRNLSDLPLEEAEQLSGKMVKFLQVNVQGII